jgi:hypothetical protein
MGESLSRGQAALPGGDGGTAMNLAFVLHPEARLPGAQQVVESFGACACRGENLRPEPVDPAHPDILRP